MPHVYGPRRTLLYPQRGARLLLRDTFTDTNGVLIAAHTPELGGAWTLRNGGYNLQDNQLNVSSAGTGTAGTLATQDAGTPNVDAYLDVIAGSGDYVQGIIGRYTDVNNLWLVGIYRAGSQIVIYEVNGGTTTLRQQAAKAFVAGNTYRLRARFSGSVITAWVDGGSEIAYGSATLNATATHFGPRQAVNTNRADNWEGWSL